MESCTKHPHELGAGICQRCGLSWCSECLVHSFGPKKPPFCVECAMFAGGVRSSAVRPAMPRREVKARLKAAKAAAKAAEKAASRGADEVEAEDAAAVEVAAPVQASDWETPWWEDASSNGRQPTFAD